MKREYTILVDAREKKPLLFPSHLPVWDPTSDPLRPRARTVRLRTRTTTLEAADYLLEGSSAIAIERKNSLTELSDNLTQPRRRRNFLLELTRLRSRFTHPYILVEGNPLTLSTQAPSNTPRTPQPPHIVRDLLFNALLSHGIGILLLPSTTVSHRRAAGEWAAALLIQGECGTWTHCTPDDSSPRPPEADTSSAPLAPNSSR